MKSIVKVAGVLLGLVVAVSGCGGGVAAGPIAVTATPSLASTQEADQLLPKAYDLIVSHHQVANAAGSVVDGVIVVNVEFVPGLSHQEQRSVLDELAQQCADAVGVNVELSVVDDAGDLDQTDV